MAMVLTVLLASAALGLGVTRFLPQDPEPGAEVLVSEGGVAASTLPLPSQSPPQPRVEAAHRALHVVGRACRQPTIDRGGDAVRAPVEQIRRFAGDYPNGGFTIDDEPGTTLSLLIVLRYELQSCEPALVPGVDALLPVEFRDPS